MAERDDADATSTNGDTRRATRRTFIDHALAATSTLALAEALPFSAAVAAAPRRAAAPAPASNAIPAGVPELIRIGQMTSRNGTLRFVMTVKSGPKLIPTGYAPTPGGQVVTTYQSSTTTPGGGPVYPMLRFYHGLGSLLGEEWPPANAAQVNPPPPKPASGPPPTPAVPGPTLHCSIGDNVEITFLNHVDVGAFGGTLDAGETGKATGCDTVKFIGANPKNGLGPGYPNNDRYPDCLHGSSSANIHFHGTHVTPSTTGDNVLVNVRPNRNVSASDVAASFATIFKYTEMMGHSPHKWEELPADFRTMQERLLKEYDRTAPWKGQRGLPLDQQLWRQNKEAIDQGVWPQWYSGAYPYSFRVPKHGVDRNDNGQPVTMGQSPGTHWYHSHKHGSTAINSFNGMSGALIITDESPTGYDGKLKSFYAKYGGLVQKVIVFQQITDHVNLLSTNVTGPSNTLVNGQFTPKITLRTGEVQLWRMINACARSTVTVQFLPLTSATPGPSPTPTPAPGTGIQFKQTAQDGVQFQFKTYNDPANGANPIIMAAANRVDLLVQAPSTPGTYTMGTTGPDGQTPTVLYVNVVAATSGQPAMPFPQAESDFPRQPGFLRDLDTYPTPIRLRRQIEYGWKDVPPIPPGRTLPDKSAYGGNLPQFTINGLQFADQLVNEVMLLGNTEEWIIVNSTAKIAHPFHIHINPFQVFEIYDPTVYASPGVPVQPPGGGGQPTPTPPIGFNTQVTKLTGPFVWWDVFAIPAGVYLPAGTVIDPKNPPIDIRTGKPFVVGGGGILPGYIKFRSRFVDFAGIYVQHCHILAHEDRGMMQLLEVVNNKTILKHH